jgi:GT2 family glycosyltransferase
MNPLISICIPTFNGEKYLQEALDSVKTQTYRNFEVIISDDNSTDKTLEICEKFKDEVDFSVYIYNHIRAGIGANWNHCIEKANGEYIKFLFQDDVLFSNCLEEMLNVFIQNKEVALVACQRNFIYEKEYLDEKLRDWINTFGNLQETLNLKFNNNFCIIKNSIFKHKQFFCSPLNKIGEPTAVMFKKKLYKEIGQFNSELKQILDYEYWYRVLKIYPIGILDIPLVNFRLHEMQATIINAQNQVDESAYFRFLKAGLLKNSKVKNYEITMQKIFSIIVTYNGMRQNWIQKCLDSLLASSVKTEIIVIDNASADETVDFIKKNYPQVDLITATENLGFAKANNICIKKAYEQNADYFFLLNQDARIEENTLIELFNVFRQTPNAGIVSSIHLNGDKSNLDTGFINYIVNQNTPNFISDLYFTRLKNYYETQFINAAAWLISRECIEKVGGFDTSVFYHYGEDVNYCQRVLYHGYKIYITPSTTICHGREGRKGKFPNEDVINQFVYYGDIQKDEKIVDDMIYFPKKEKIKQYIKLLLKLQIKSIFIKRKMFRDEMNLFLRIKNSRTKNKQGGLVWLDDESLGYTEK